jgi:hypothetical protein
MGIWNFDGKKYGFLKNYKIIRTKKPKTDSTKAKLAQILWWLWRIDGRTKDQNSLPYTNFEHGWTLPRQICMCWIGQSRIWTGQWEISQNGQKHI